MPKPLAPSHSIAVVDQDAIHTLMDVGRYDQAEMRALDLAGKSGKVHHIYDENNDSRLVAVVYPDGGVDYQ